MSVEKIRFHRAAENYWPRLRPHFQDFHRLSVTKPYEYPLHRHADYEMILVAKGPYQCSLNGVELRLVRHQLLIIKPGDWHQDHLRPGQFHFVLHFQLHALHARNRKSINVFSEDVVPSQQICESRFSRETALFKELELEATHNGAFSSAIQDSLLEILFWRAVRALPPNALSLQLQQTSEVQTFADALFRVFERHHRQHLPVDRMAEALKMSRRNLSLKCQQVLGASPAHAFLTFKVQKAVHLLTTTHVSIKELSYYLGFSDPYHFSRIFKRVTGKPPSWMR